MYKPARPRPKKTDIVRSRNGCKSCRERRTKCDERKPSCGTCIRLGRVCETINRGFQFRVVTSVSEKPSTKTGPAGPDLGPLQLQQSFSGYGHSHALPNIDLIHSLQHTDRDVFYTTYWEDNCLPALHPIFRSASESLGLPALKDAILALSSCNISRIHAERKSPTSVVTSGTFCPNLSHQTRSQLYYSSAIRKFTSLTTQDYQNNVTLVLTILVLFGYIEASMGNFHGFYHHVQGLSGLLVELRDTTGDPFFRALLSAWLQSQYLVWWARAYFSSLYVQRHLPSIPFPSMLEETSNSIHDRRVVALSILCESHRLNAKAALRYWQLNEEPNPTFYLHNLQPDPEFDAQLKNQSHRLDKWLLQLPASEQPIATTTPETSPIFFQSHDAALNFAYHVVARIMQCTSFLHNLPFRDPQHLGTECSEMKPWVRLLLQIAQGTNQQTLLTRNTYSIGFSGLLLAASLRCQDQTLRTEIEKWLQALQEKQPTEEGAFPVYQALAVVKAINQQREIGHDVFAVSQPVDDGGGEPKFTCYNSQMISTLLVHGKRRDSGELFTECIDLDM